MPGGINPARARRLLPGVRRAVKGRASDWHGHLADAANRGWQRPDGRSVALADFEASGDQVAFRVQVSEADGTLAFEYFHVITNPPVATPDGGSDADGKPTYARNLAGAIRAVVDARLEGMMA